MTKISVLAKDCVFAIVFSWRVEKCSTGAGISAHSEPSENDDDLAQFNARIATTNLGIQGDILGPRFDFGQK